MKSDNAQPRAGEFIASLLALDDEGRPLWPAAELQVALRKELARPLQDYAETLDRFGLPVAVREDALTGTLAQLLLHDPAPSVAALRALKSFAKHEVNTPRASLPPDVALLLYYGAIIAARLRRNERISRLKDDDLRRGLNWAARQLWIDPTTRDLFLQGLSHLRSPRSRWRHQ